MDDDLAFDVAFDTNAVVEVVLLLLFFALAVTVVVFVVVVDGDVAVAFVVMHHL